MNNDWLTLAEVSQITSIPTSTVRRYLSQHGIVIRNKKKSGKGYVIHPQDVQVIQQIRLAYEEGRTTEEIDDILRQNGAPIEVSVSTVEETKMLLPAEAFMQLQTVMSNMSEEINTLKAQLYAMHQEIHSLKEQQKQSEETTMGTLETLHNQNQDMLTALTTVSDGLSRLERNKEERSSQSWLARLFGK